LNKGITLTITDKREDSEKNETFSYKKGLAEFVTFLRGNRKPLHPKPITLRIPSLSSTTSTRTRAAPISPVSSPP
jgi:DNA gyrase/topoisomerase IV subunit B